MKHILLAIAALSVVACNSGETKTNHDEKDDHMSVAKRNTENIKKVYQGIETGDMSVLDSIVSDNVVDHNVGPNGTDVVGKENVKKMLAEIHTYFDNLKMEYISDATSADGEYQFALIRMTGKVKANPWMLKVGSDMDDMVVDVVKIKDNRATDHWGFTSQKDVHESMMEMMEGMKTMTKADSAGKK